MPSPEDFMSCETDYAPSILKTMVLLQPLLQKLKDITIEVIMSIDPVHSQNYTITWLNQQILPLAYLPRNTIIKVKLPLYDSRVEELKGNQLHHRPWFLANGSGVDNQGWDGPEGVIVVGWFCYGHWDGERCWSCLVGEEGRGRFKRFDAKWWDANPLTGRGEEGDVDWRVKSVAKKALRLF